MKTLIKTIWHIFLAIITLAAIIFFAIASMASLFVFGITIAIATALKINPGEKSELVLINICGWPVYMLYAACEWLESIPSIKR